MTNNKMRLIEKFKVGVLSFKKSRLLSLIASETQKPFDAKELVNIMLEKTPDKRELYIGRLFVLLARDKYTIGLLAAYGRDFDDMRKIIRILEQAGAGRIVKGHYVAVSSVAFVKQLAFALEYWDGENFKFEELDSYGSNLHVALCLIASFN